MKNTNKKKAAVYLTFIAHVRTTLELIIMKTHASVVHLWYVLHFGIYENLSRYSESN